MSSHGLSHSISTTYNRNETVCKNSLSPSYLVLFSPIQSQIVSFRPIPLGEWEANDGKRTIFMQRDDQAKRSTLMRPLILIRQLLLMSLTGRVPLFQPLATKMRRFEKMQFNRPIQSYLVLSSLIQSNSIFAVRNYFPSFVTFASFCENTNQSFFAALAPKQPYSLRASPDLRGSCVSRLRVRQDQPKKTHASKTIETNVTTAKTLSQGLNPSLPTTYKANVTNPKNDCLTVTIVSNCNIL